jgi:hypothetical protein
MTDSPPPREGVGVLRKRRMRFGEQQRRLKEGRVLKLLSRIDRGGRTRANWVQSCLSLHGYPSARADRLALGVAVGSELK